MYFLLKLRDFPARHGWVLRGRRALSPVTSWSHVTAHVGGSGDLGSLDPWGWTIRGYGQWLFLVPVKGGIGSIFHPPEGKDYKWYISGIFPANWGMDYATYHLLRAPKTTIDMVVVSNTTESTNGWMVHLKVYSTYLKGKKQKHHEASNYKPPIFWGNSSRFFFRGCFVFFSNVHPDHYWKIYRPIWRGLEFRSWNRLGCVMCVFCDEMTPKN